MAVGVHRCDASLGAVVTGVALATLSDDDWAVIADSFLEYGVLIFPDQHLSDQDQVAFGKRFGEIEHLFGDRGIIPITNMRRDGSLMKRDEELMQVMIGNEGWHTDSSYMPLAAKASMLSAHVVPTSGGQTEWADMRAAYEALDEETKSRIADLSAHHSIEYSQAKIGHNATKAAGYGFQGHRVPLRPLIKHHPETRRPALYIGRHAHEIPGLSSERSEALLAELLDFACRPPRVVRHEWKKGDVAVWDNRCVLHRARPYDLREARVMKHTRIAGDPATETAQ